MSAPEPVRRTSCPVLAADRPWERGGRLSAVSVLPDEGGTRLRLYYLLRFPDHPCDNALCVADGADGYAWTKPDLGDGTNIVMRSSGHPTDWGVFMPTRVLHDPRAPDPAHRWKMVYWDRPSAAARPGICRAMSPDGYRWTPLDGERPLITGANDAMSLIDVRPGPPTPFHAARFFIYQQTWRYNPALPQDRDNLKGMHRRISIWTAPAFDGRWIGPVMVLAPDADDPPDVQFYWLTPFHLAEGYGGLLACHHTGNQTMDLQLVTSDDGWDWRRRRDRRPLLAPGPPGRFDCGMVSAMAPPIRWRGRWLLFYNGRATVHDGRRRYPAAPAPDPAHGIGVAELAALT